MANKSLAETVNFGNAVKTQAYNKAAKQVDTFVQSETAEQKLARSEKMQIAKSLEAIAGFGGSVLGYQAKQAQQNTEQMRRELTKYVGQAMAEVESGAAENWTQTQVAKNMPVVLHMELANGITKQHFIKEQEEFEVALAEDPTIHFDDARYQQLVNDTFVFDAYGFAGEDGLDSPLGALSQASYNNFKNEYFSKANVAKAKAQNAHKVSELEDTVGVKIDDILLGVGRTVDDYTTVGADNELVVDQERWGLVSSYDPLTKTNQFDRKKYAKVVMDNLLLQDSELLKNSGLKIEQYKPVLQDRILKAAQVLKMPELLDEIPHQFRSRVFNIEAERLQEQVSDEAYNDWYRGEQRRDAERKQAVRQAEAWAFETSANNQIIDLSAARELGADHYDAALAMNKKLRSSVTDTQSSANMLELKRRIIRAKINGTPLIGLDGKEVTDANGDRLELTEENIASYMMMHPDIHKPHVDLFIEEIDSIMSTANLSKNEFYLEGVTDVEEMMKGGRYFTYGAADKRTLTARFENIFQRNWRATQKTMKGDLRNDLDAQKEVMNKSVQEWMNLPVWSKNPQNEMQNTGGQNRTEKPKFEQLEIDSIPLEGAMLEKYQEGLAKTKDVEAYKDKWRERKFIVPED
jgi:hypothetical protein